MGNTRKPATDTTADRMAAAYFDAIEFLCEVTPMGWYTERGTARAGDFGRRSEPAISTRSRSG